MSHQNPTSRTTLEKFADIATIISSFSIIGVVFAFMQINAANKQIDLTSKQIDSTNQQFKVQFAYQSHKDSEDKKDAFKKDTAENNRNRKDIERLNNQFLTLNQSYLVTDLKINDPDPPSGNVVHQEAKVQALNFTINIYNAGNIVMKYTVDDFDIIIGQKIVQGLEKNVYSIGILYPKQSLEFHLAQVKGDYLPFYYKHNDKKIFCRFIINYSDYSYSKKKKINDKSSPNNKRVSRIYKIEYNGNGGWGSILTQIKDKI